eukprot:5107989-Karenia_brevis.AAC.1
MVGRAPEILTLLAPKGTKRSKSAEVNLFVAYNMVLSSLVQLDDAMQQLPESFFGSQNSDAAVLMDQESSGI